MTFFERIVSEFKGFGVVYAIDRWTGALKPLSMSDYLKAARAGLLEGYVIRLDPKQAEATASEMRARPLN